MVPRLLDPTSRDRPSRNLKTFRPRGVTLGFSRTEDPQGIPFVFFSSMSRTCYISSHLRMAHIDFTCYVFIDVPIITWTAFIGSGLKTGQGVTDGGGGTEVRWVGWSGPPVVGTQQV